MGKIERYQTQQNIDSLVQDCSISSAYALEILQSCTKSSIYTVSIFLGMYSRISDTDWYKLRQNKQH